MFFVWDTLEGIAPGPFPNRWEAIDRAGVVVAKGKTLAVVRTALVPIRLERRGGFIAPRARRPA
jgi:hypothetical protein